jgi:multiple sugar transport system substrate-binding protein
MEDSFLINSDAAAGYLLPLDKYVNGWNEWGNFVSNIKQGMMSQDGKIYGVPYNTDTRGLWYNKVVFKQAGLPANWQPKNWNDILTACAAIQAKCPGVVPFGANLGKAAGEATSMQTYEMLLYGTGERLLTSGANGKWIVSSPGINASLNFIQTLANKKYVDLATSLNSNPGATNWQKLMPQNKIGIILDGNWNASNYLPGGGTNWPTWKTDLGFTAMPTNNGQAPGTITLAGGWGWSIPKNSKNPDTAWSFIKFISTKAHMMSLDLALGNIATRTDVANDAAFNTVNPFNKIASEFMTNAQFRPLNTLYPTVSTQIQAMVESVASGTAVKTAITTYGNAVKRIAGAANTTTK